MQKAQEASELSGEVFDVTLFDYYVYHCSYYAEDNQDADVHLEMLSKPWFHMTCADDEAMLNWKLNDFGEIELMCNRNLGKKILEAKPHWPSLKEPNYNDSYVWGTTSFLNALHFMHNHHKQDLKKGTVLHCFVFTALNEAHRPRGAKNPRAGQYKMASGTIASGHGCIVKVSEKAVPCQVLRVEMMKDYVVGETTLEEMLEITAIRVNRNMKARNAVKYDAKEKGRFVITKYDIRCECEANDCLD